MVAIYREAAKFGYRPTLMLGMVREHGGLEAAKRLLSAEHPASGLERL